MRVAWGTVVGRGWEGLYTTLCPLFGGVGGCGLWYWAALLPWGGALPFPTFPCSSLLLVSGMVVVEGGEDVTR